MKITLLIRQDSQAGMLYISIIMMIFRWKIVALVAAATLGLSGALLVSACEDEKSAGTTPTTATAAPAVEPVTSFEGCVARGYPVLESNPARCVTPDGQEFVEETAATAPTTPATDDTDECVALSAKICVRTPRADAVVTSPLVVEGEAAGWYFEGEFPVRLVDANGADLAWASAWAQGSWMTAEAIPFKATITFAPPATATGKLVLTRSDPRGDVPAEIVEIPVRFTP